MIKHYNYCYEYSKYCENGKKLIGDYLWLSMDAFRIVSQEKVKFLNGSGHKLMMNTHSESFICQFSVPLILKGGAITVTELAVRSHDKTANNFPIFYQNFRVQIIVGHYMHI